METPVTLRADKYVDPTRPKSAIKTSIEADELRKSLVFSRAVSVSYITYLGSPDAPSCVQMFRESVQHYGAADPLNSLPTEVSVVHS